MGFTLTPSNCVVEKKEVRYSPYSERAQKVGSGNYSEKSLVGV